LGSIEKRCHKDVKEKLSKRAVVKEDGLGECIFKKKTNTKRNLARVTTSPRAGCRQSLMDMLVEWAMESSC